VASGVDAAAAELDGAGALVDVGVDVGVEVGEAPGEPAGGLEAPQPARITNMEPAPKTLIKFWSFIGHLQSSEFTSHLAGEASARSRRRRPARAFERERARELAAPYLASDVARPSSAGESAVATDSPSLDRAACK
jgi:hypothetical protein